MKSEIKNLLKLKLRYLTVEDGNDRKAGIKMLGKESEKATWEAIEWKPNWH